MHHDSDDLDYPYRRSCCSWYRHLGPCQGMVTEASLEAIAKFLAGGLLGWAWEKRFSPELKGRWPGVPFRPIYGAGASAASQDLGKNMALSICAEKIGNAKKKLWKYDPNDFFAIDEDVRADYTVAFGEAMTTFSDIWNKLFHKA